MELFLEVHYQAFGISYIFVAVWCLRISIRGHGMSYGVNGVAVMFIASRGLIFLSHRFVNEQGKRVYSIERFLFNIALPCLITAYIRTCYLFGKCLEGQAKRVFSLVVLQCNLFIITDFIRATFAYGLVVLTIQYLLISCAGIIGLCTIIIYTKTHYACACNNSYRMVNKYVVKANNRSRSFCEIDVNQHSNTTKKSANIEKFVTAVVLCIGIACALVKACIMLGISNIWDGKLNMDSCSSFVFENILRMIELDIAIVMFFLIHRITVNTDSLLPRLQRV